MLAALVAVPLLMWMFRAMRSLDVPQSQAFLDYNTVRVEEFQQATADGAIGVVLMGDSRVRYGTELQEVLSERIGDELGQDVAVLRLTYDWGTYEDFAPLMPMIAEADPSLVILQEELRLKNRGYDASEAIKREYLWWRLLPGDEVWNPGGKEQVLYQEEMECEPLGVEPLDQRLVRLGRWVDFDENGAGAELVRELVDDLEQAGVPLRYLDVPLSSDAEAVLPSVELSQPPLGLAPDITFDDADYCDFVHMNETSRAQYTNWFVDAVTEELTTALEQS